MRRKFLTSDRLAAIVFAVVILAYGYEAMQLEATLEGDVIGPSFFPKLLVVFGLGLAAIQFFAWRAPPPKDEGADSVSEKAEPGIFQNLAKQLDDLLPLALMVAYVALLFPLGFIISTVLYTTATMKLLRQPTWFGAFGFAALLTGLVFVVFQLILGIPLPVGTLLEGVLGGTYGG